MLARLLLSLRGSVVLVAGVRAALLGRWPSMASTGKGNQGANRRQDFRNHPVGGTGTIGAGFRAERISAYEPGCNQRAATLLSRK